MEERLQRRLVLGGLDAPGTELVVAPPQTPIDLLAPRRRQRLGVERVQQRLRALQRSERIALARLLHAADGLGGELADLAAERAGEELLERLGQCRREARLGQRLAQEPARRAELLALRQRRGGIHGGDRKNRGVQRLLLVGPGLDRAGIVDREADGGYDRHQHEKEQRHHRAAARTGKPTCNS